MKISDANFNNCSSLPLLQRVTTNGSGERNTNAIELTQNKLDSIGDPELIQLQKTVVRLGVEEVGVDYRQNMRAVGSGIIISPNGFIITNHHVIEEIEKLRNPKLKVSIPTNKENDPPVIVAKREKVMPWKCSYREPFANAYYDQNLVDETFQWTQKGCYFKPTRYSESDYTVNQRVCDFEVIKKHPYLDLALVRINTSSADEVFEFAKFEEGDSQVKSGDDSYTWGHPCGVQHNVLRLSEIIANPQTAYAEYLSRKSGEPNNDSEKKEIEEQYLKLLRMLNASESFGFGDFYANSYLFKGDSGGMQSSATGKLLAVNTSAYDFPFLDEASPILTTKHNRKTIARSIPARDVLHFLEQLVNVDQLLRGQGAFLLD